MRARVQIVTTPGSGEGRASSTARRLLRALTRRGYVASIQTFADLAALERWAQTCGPSMTHLVAVGGDATLSATATAAIRLAVPFVPVPGGFGNIFAAAFGHGSQTGRVIDLFEHGEVRSVDVGAAGGGDVFLSHRSYGMLEAIQRAVEAGRAQPRQRLRRHLAYYATARRYVLGAPLPSVRVEVDGQVVAGDAAVVTVANVETYRGFLSLTPAASPVDGLFDVCAIPRAAKPVFWLRLFKLLLGSASRWDGLVRCRGRRARVTVAGAPPEELSVRRGVLRLLVPPGSIERLEARRAAAERAESPAPVIERRGAA
jgi:diacylglycerol kinase family enzyme